MTQKSTDAQSLVQSKMVLIKPTVAYQIKKVFEGMDKNGDGLLTADDFQGLSDTVWEHFCVLISDQKGVVLPACDLKAFIHGLKIKVLDSQEVRVVSRSISPPWRSIRFRLALRTYAPWGVRVVSQTKSRKIPTRNILPLFFVRRPQCRQRHRRSHLR